MINISKDMIAALVDGEITDIILKQEIYAKIESDKDFAIEFKVQSILKSLVKEKITFQKTPDKVRAKILKSIGSNTKAIQTKTSLISNIFEKPLFSFATAFVVLLSIILIILNRPGIVEKEILQLNNLGVIICMFKQKIILIA